VRTRRTLALVATSFGLIASTMLVASPAHASLPGYSHLRNAITDKCADVAGISTDAGAIVHQWSCGGDSDTNQQWAVIDLQNGFIELLNGNGGIARKCLNARGGFDGAIVEQQWCDQRVGEQWRFLLADSSGHLVLQSQFGNLCMALTPFSTANGTAIVLRPCATTSAQFYSLTN
jgi:hypothetical protein